MTLTAELLAPSEPHRLLSTPRGEFGAAAASRDVPTPSRATIQFEIGTPLAELERRALLATLDHCAGNKRRAAELCGVSLKTLYNRLAAYRDEADGARAAAGRARAAAGATR